VQRISLKRYATMLSEEDTYRYLQHRIDVAGYKGSSLFDQGAQKLIWEFSNGIPRKINILSDNALLIGYGLVQKQIDEEIVSEAVRDLTWSPYMGTVESQDSLPQDSRMPYPEEDNAPISSENNTQSVPGEQDTVPQEIQLTDEEQSASMMMVIQPPDMAEPQQEVFKSRRLRRQSSLIAGFLILVCLIIIAWFLIAKPKLNLGVNISLHRQNIVQTEPINELNSFSY